MGSTKPWAGGPELDKHAKYELVKEKESKSK